MDDPREALYRNLYTAIGQMTLRWAAVEMAVDVLVAIIFRTLPTSKKKFPRAVSEKTEFLKNCFSQINELKGLEQEAKPLIDHITEAAGERNWLIHGVVSSTEFEETKSLRLSRTKYQTLPVRIDQKTVTLADIDGFSVQFLALMNDVDCFSRAVEIKLNNAIS